MTTTVASLQAVFTADTSGFDAGLGRVESGMQRAAGGISGRLDSIGNRMAGLGQKIAIPAAAVNAFMGLSLNAAMNFESAFAGVVKTVDGTDIELAALRDTIRDMATDSTNPLAGLDNAHETIAKIMELGGQLGVPLENLEGFAQTIGSMTIATDLTAENAAMMLAQFAAITGMDFTDMDKLGSTIVALGNNMPTTESQIVEFGQRLAGIGATIGLSEAEIMALGAAMSGMGLNAEAGGTAMTQVFNEMISAVAGGGTDLENFAAVAGTSADEFAAAWEANPTTALQDFLVGLGGLDEAAQVQALEDLGLDGVRVADTLRRLSGNTEMLSDALEIANEGWEENTALNEEAQKRLATTRAQFNVFKNTLKDVAISIGGALLPIFNKVLETLQPMAKAFSNFIQGNPALVRAFGKIGAILGVVAGGLIVFGKILAGVALLFNPISMAILAFVAIWETNFLGLRESVSEIAGAIIHSFNRIKRFVGGLVDAFQDGGLTAAVDFFKNNIDSLIRHLGNIWGKVDFGAMAQRVLDGISGAFSALSSAGGWVMDNIVSPLADNIKNTDWMQVGTSVVDGLKSALATAGDTLGSIWEWLFGGSEWMDLGDGMAVQVDTSGAVDWVRDNVVDPMLDAAGDALGSFWDWLFGTSEWLDFGDGMAVQVSTSGAVGWINDNVVTPLLDAIPAVIGKFWEWLFGTSEWLDFGDGMAVEVNTGGAVNWVRDNVLMPFIDAIGQLPATLGSVWDWLFGQSEWMDLGDGMAVQTNSGGMVGWFTDNVLTPMVNDARTAIEGVDWQNVGYAIMDGIGNAIGAAFDFVTWIINSIFSPTVESSGAAAEGTDWSAVGSAILNAIAAAIGAVWDVSSWVFTTILGPMVIGMFMRIAEMDWSSIPNVLFNMLATAIGAVWDVVTWVFDNIISPLFNAFLNGITGVDWGSIPTAIFNALRDALPDIGQWVQQNILDPITDAITGFRPPSINILGVQIMGGGDDEPEAPGSTAMWNQATSAISNQAAANQALYGGGSSNRQGFSVGTPWTGFGNLDAVAGVVHAREAVVPASGMMVTPSPNGLMLSGSMGGGGGNTVIITQLDVHGVENVDELYDQLLRVSKQRA